MRHIQTSRQGSRQTTPRVPQQQQQSCPPDQQAAHKPVSRSVRHPRSRTRHDIQHAPCSTGSERVEQQQQQLQQGIHHHRRALLIAAGLCPLLTAAVSTGATAHAADSISQSVESAVGTSSTGDTDQQQQQSPASSGVSEQGTDATASESVAGGAADQANSDDLPSQTLEESDEDDDSSSSSSSDSDSDSDSDSSSDDEPGELYANSNDNNAAGGSSSSSSSGGDSSSSNSINSSGSNGTEVTSSSSSTGTTNVSNTSSSGSSSSKPAGRTVMGSNLSVPSYIQILQDSRRSSWPLLAQKIQAAEWIELSQLLVQPPFDAVRQACFYIPWALLQSDDFTAAVAARKAYVDYIDHVHALAAIALKAADGVPGADVQVQQAFTLMNASLNAFLSAVPIQYQRYRV